MIFVNMLIQVLVKMVIVGVFAFAGLMLGRYLRRRREDKKKDTIEK